MGRNRGARIFGGVLLIALGAYLLLVQFYPELQIFESFSWPLIIIGVGALMLIFGIRKYKRGKLFEERLRPLLGRKYSASNDHPAWSLAPIVSDRGPTGLALTTTF